MGRKKSVPTKLPLSSNGWDYIPKKRRNRRKSAATPSYKVTTTISKEIKQYHVGQVSVGITNNVIPESWESCKVTFQTSEDETERLLIHFDSTITIVQLLLDLDIIKDIIVSKVFAIGISQKGEEVCFDLYFTQLPLSKFNKKVGTCIQAVFSLLYNIVVDNIPESTDSHDHEDRVIESKRQEIDELYKNIKSVREGNLTLSSQDVQHPRLKPELRPYQEDAVRWMLARETQCEESSETLHPLYMSVVLKSGQEIFYDKYTGHVELEKPLVSETMKGGILADEMGLGKTVEVLACILMNPKPSQDDKSESDSDLEKSPTIEKVSRKRKFCASEVKQNNFRITDEEKKLNIPDNWVKSSSKKTQLRVALEMWYESCLQDVTGKSGTSRPTTSVQCICGGDNEEGTVTCDDCGKIQHANCLGYKRKYGKYKCPQCWMNQPLLESGATLIVSPISLRTQWCKEICRHVKGEFRVLQYEGSSLTPIYPTELLKYDLVITTYNVLQSELRLTEGEKVLSFRYQRRYSAPGSPLTRVHWWRLCLDEAQTVETPTSMVSAMAQKLSAHYRWAVTGTPISNEISDLYGLIDYLQMKPYNEKLTWQYLLFDPYVKGNTESMHKFLSQVLWRTTKNEVINQINIPRQTIEEHWLTFSAIEQYFYKCEHQSNRDAFLEKVRYMDPDTSLQSLNKSTLKNILAPLLSLRHVCTCPNSVRTRYLATKKPVNSMKELLEALILKNTNECEEYLRLILSCLNGLAGIYLLLESPEMGIQKYREALQLYTRFIKEEKVVKLNVDKLQVIHTMHNLAEILECAPSGIDRTLRDDTLRRDCKDIEQKYIEKFINQTMTSLQDSLLISNSVQRLQDSFILEPGKWYGDILDWIYIHDYNQELYTRVENALAGANVDSTINFRNEKRLIYSIATWDDIISELRETSIEVVNCLYTHCPDDEFKILISQELVQKATDCHLRPQKKANTKKKCPLCVANDHLKEYEFKLFSMTKRTETFEDMSLKGSWKPTTEELIFKSILAVGRAKNADRDLVKDGEVHINLIETLKKEFKEIRKLWTLLDQQICAQDELDMCKIRLRLKEANEEDKTSKKLTPILKNLTYKLENKLETIHVLDEHEVEYQRTSLHNEENQNRAYLEKKLGIRSYLETLHKQQFEGQNPDPCPICKNSLEQHYSIIPCGHSYCIECIQSLIEQSRGHHVHCSVCRVHHPVADISYIKQGEQSDDSDNINIKGNYSTKVESVIKLILNLRSEDEDVKILVFSSWVSVLNYIKVALTINHISSELVVNTNLEKQIEKFKDSKERVTTLLLPVHLGSKGLNLIEATHVILIEPLFNLGDELQAIGRVHRIGQTRPTVVHKFFIKNTIEESIQKATSTNAQNWEKNKVTLRQLIDLFVPTESNNEETANVIPL